jgi:hypothetical protein
VGQIVVVNPEATPSFKLSAGISTLSVPRNNGTTVAVTTTPVNGFNGSINYTSSGVPSGASSTFVNSSSGGSTFVIFVSTSTKPGSYTITITGTSGSTTASTTFTLVVS